MVLPESLGVVTLTGSFIKPDGDDGTPDTGTITIRSDTVLTAASGSMVGPFFFRAELVDGAFAIPNVPVTDDPDWSPAGWTYLIKEALSGSTRTYYVVIPNTSAGTTVDLAGLSPVVNNPLPDTYVLKSTADQPNGYPKLDGDGLISPDVLPGGSGDSVAWASITGKPSTYPPSTHTHDDRYYTETEIDDMLDGLSGGGSGPVSWSSVTGKPSTFPPDAHTHIISDVTSLQSVLDGKASSGHSHTAPAWTDVTGKPATFTPSAHTHDDRYYTETEVDTLLGGKLDSTYAPSWSAVTGKPSTFAPSAHDHNDLYYTKAQVDTSLGGKAATVHTHDDRYYTEGEVDTALTGKANATHTHAQSDVSGLGTALSGKEPAVATGTNSQYYRGDKSWQTLDKTAVGLANVDNTADTAKPVSTAQATAIGLKVTAPATNAANGVPRWNGADSKTLKTSGISIDDTGSLILPASADVSYAQGRLFYNGTEDALEFHNAQSAIKHQLGYEQLVNVRNESGSTIADGAAVYIMGSSATNNLPTIGLARSDDPSTVVAIGITTMAIPNNSNGVVTTDGVVHTDTSAFAAGASLFISATTAGALTATAPAAPNYRMRIGVVGRSHASLGTILVTPTMASLATGTANQFLSVHPSSGRQQWKTVSGTAGKVVVTHADGTTAITVPATGPLPTVAALTDAATIATDASLASHFRVTLAGNRALGVPTNPTDGQRVLWEFVQDATGGRTITLNAVFVNFTGATITLPTAANKRAYMGAVYKLSTATWDVIAFAIQP